ncbi:Nif11 family protein [Microcystis sp. LE19-10.1B]|jgi:hypothetical protein
MSVEQTKAFYQRIATDKDFRSRFQNLVLRFVLCNVQDYKE